MVDAAESLTSFRAYVDEVLAKSDKLSHENMALLVSCMDFRYPHRIVAVMDELGLSGKYDHFVLAGASLGSHVPAWQDVLIKHIEAALILGHHIKKIVFLDHRDCGAYRYPKEIGVPADILDNGLVKDILPSTELNCHLSVVQKLVPVLKSRLKKLIPDLKVDAILLTRDEDDILLEEK
jgi:hypothetical protein